MIKHSDKKDYIIDLYHNYRFDDYTDEQVEPSYSIVDNFIYTYHLQLNPDTLEKTQTFLSSIDINTGERKTLIRDKRIFDFSVKNDTIFYLAYEYSNVSFDPYIGCYDINTSVDKILYDINSIEYLHHLQSDLTNNLYSMNWDNVYILNQDTQEQVASIDFTTNGYTSLYNIDGNENYILSTSSTVNLISKITLENYSFSLDSNKDIIGARFIHQNTIAILTQDYELLIYSYSEDTINKSIDYGFIKSFYLGMNSQGFECLSMRVNENYLNLTFFLEGRSNGTHKDNFTFNIPVDNILSSVSINTNDKDYQYSKFYVYDLNGRFINTISYNQIKEYDSKRYFIVDSESNELILK